MNEEKAVRYHRLRRRASLSAAALGALLLGAFLVTGGSAALRGVAVAAGGGGFLATITIYVVALALLSEALQLPLAFYQGVVLERRYGLSVQTTAQWWRDWGKGIAVALVFAVGAALVVWALLRESPQYWWLIAALCFGFVLVLLAQLAPVLLLPLFYTFKPLERPALAARLARLAQRSRARVVGVFEWRVGDRTRKANAALTGIGRTRRILLSDTMLAEYSDEEIEVIVAHELAHHVHHDIWRTIGLEIVLLTTGLHVADRILEPLVGRFGITAKDDIAALPVLLLAIGAVSVVLLPAANAFSRACERRADRFAMDMTRNATAFASAMRRLASQNLAEEQPPRVVELLFHSHPPIRARLDAAQEWAARHGGSEAGHSA